MTTIDIPLIKSGHTLELSISDLDNIEFIGTLIRDEDVPFDICLKIARIFDSQHKYENFEKIIQLCLKGRHNISQEEGMIALNTLTSHLLTRASRAREKDARDDLLTKALDPLNSISAEYMGVRDTHDHNYFLGYYYHAFLNGNDFSAGRDLNKLTKEVSDASNPDRLVHSQALLCLGAISYERGDYRAALDAFRDALELNPDLPAAARLGVAYCWFMIGKEENALRAFERILEMDPKNSDALTGKGAILLNYFNSDDLEENNLERQAMAKECLIEAYKIDPTNPVACNCISDFYFYQDNIEQARSLAQKAKKLTLTPEIKAESDFRIGRSYHVLHNQCSTGSDNISSFVNLHQAEKHYEFALNSNPDHYLARYCLAQIALLKNNFDKALEHLERVRKQRPYSLETKRLHAHTFYLVHRTTRIKECVHFLREVAKTKEYSEDIHILLALAHVVPNKQESLMINEKVLDILSLDLKSAIERDDTSRISILDRTIAQLRNNIGVLELTLHHFDSAKDSFFKSIGENGDPKRLVEDNNITACYNLARLFEESHQFERAIKIYRAIIKKHASYHDCWVRLCMISRTRGQLEKAEKYLREAMNTAINKGHKDINLWILQFSIQAQRGQDILKSIQEMVKKPKEYEHAPDDYPRLLLANIFYQKYLSGAPPEKSLKISRKIYIDVLAKNPRNVYAVVGIGICLAEEHLLTEARDFFLQVREVMDIPSVYINLGHIYVGLQQYKQAILQYQLCLKKFYHNTNVEVLLYLATAHFEAGEHVNALRVVERALHLYPTDLTAWFTRSVIQLDYTKVILSRFDGPSPVADSSVPTNNAFVAASTFDTLVEVVRQLDSLSVIHFPRKGASINAPISKHWHLDTKDPTVAHFCERIPRQASRLVEEARQLVSRRDEIVALAKSRDSENEGKLQSARELEAKLKEEEKRQIQIKQEEQEFNDKQENQAAEEAFRRQRELAESWKTQTQKRRRGNEPEEALISTSSPLSTGISRQQRKLLDTHARLGSSPTQEDPDSPADFARKRGSQNIGIARMERLRAAKKARLEAEKKEENRAIKQLIAANREEENEKEEPDLFMEDD